MARGSGEKLGRIAVPVSAQKPRICLTLVLILINILL